MDHMHPQRNSSSSPTRTRPSHRATDLNPELSALREIALGIAGRIKDVERALLDDRTEPSGGKKLPHRSLMEEELDLDEPTASPSPAPVKVYQAPGSPQVVLKKPRLSVEEIPVKQPVTVPAPAPVTIRIPTLPSSWIPQVPTSPAARKDEMRRTAESVHCPCP